MRLVPIQCVKENTFLAKTIYDNEGKILLKEGSVLTESIIKKIESIHIHTLYITDEYSDEIIEEVIKPEIRQKAINSIKEKFENAKTNTDEAKAEQEFESISYMAKQIIEEILSKKEIVQNLVDIKSFENYQYQHSVNVAIISLMIGMKLDFHKYDLIDLCMGALLHDVGMVFVPKEILNKPDKLTKEEFEIVKQHTTRGYDYLRESYHLSITAVLVALFHHEKISGQGYPEGRSGERISKFAKIVAIADVYDALTSDRPYRKALSPNEAIEYIMANGGIHFDYTFVKEFAKIIIPYAVGTYVKLSNGEIAVVEKTNSNVPLRPEVKIIYSKDKERIDTKLDLKSEIGIVIEDVQYELPKD